MNGKPHILSRMSSFVLRISRSRCGSWLMAEHP